MRKEVFSLLLILAVQIQGKSSIPDERWDYVNVRPNVNMFWWLYGAQSQQRDKLPLVLWLQGGPGGSGTGFGNFLEIGPLYQNSTARTTTWIQKTNLLFIDNPVGAGFSYVTDPAAYARNITQITDDLLVVFKTFITNLTIFEDSPFYIFGESYGGKIAATFGQTLQETIKIKEIKCNFKGVALGDSWISPADSVLSWGAYLYQYNLLDKKDFRAVQKVAGQAINYLDQKLYSKSAESWSRALDLIGLATDKVNVYNVLQHNATTRGTIDNFYTRLVGVYYQPDLANFMNTAIRKKLGIIPNNVKWGAQAESAFKYQSEDLLKPVIKEVDYLISQGLKVVVYQGQLDMLCDTAGAEKWINKLQWSGMQGFNYATRKPLYVDSKKAQTQAFLKSYGDFSLYYILNAGLMVPLDNGEIALKMLEEIINVT